MNNYELLDRLLKAETETEVDSILKEEGLLNDDRAIWQPFGGFEMNLNQINNQQSDATAALVEKLINSIDAVLMAECYQAGIDPKSKAAPRTMAQAVERLFKVKDGRLENLTAREQTKLAEDHIHFVATGLKREPCYLVIDKGEGQTPDSFNDTFLSLTKQNKDDIPFVQGRFNCGGTGVLPFCGEHKYQLILSRRHPSCPARPDDPTKDLWGFTLIRRQKPAPGRKSSMYVYLAPNKAILTFARSSVPVLPGTSGKNRPAQAYAVELPYGTCIKLYNYRWKKKTMVTTDGRYHLERYLHSVPLPVRISETRDYTANFYSTTLSGILAQASEEGKDDSDSKFEKDLGPAYGELNLPEIGRLPYRLFLLKETYDAGNFSHGVYFTLNGQVHGDLPANFVSTTLKFDYLQKTLLVSVDCTEMDQAVREDFLMASRDRVRRNEAYDSIYKALKEELKEHPALRLYNAQRRKKRLEDTLSKEENTADYFQELLKSDPTLASILGIGGNVITTTGPTPDPVPFVGRKFPTYFRIAKEPKNGLLKVCPLNRTVRVEFETDASNDYFDRPDCPGSIVFDPPNLCISNHLWDGEFTAKFQMPCDAKVGDLVNMTVTVTDIEREAKGNFVSSFNMKGAPETEDRPSPPPGTRPPGPGPVPDGPIFLPQLVAPDIREVRREKWNEFAFDEYSAVNIIHAEGENGFVFFVNMDNRFLIHELQKAKQGEESLVKHWFKYGVVLSALGIIKELERVEERRTEGEDKEGDPEEVDNLQKVSRFCAGLARVVVPMIRALHKGPTTVIETAMAA